MTDLCFCLYHFKYSEALLLFKTAIQLNSKREDFWLSYGSVLFVKNLFEDAEASFNKVLELKKEHPIAYFNLGKAYLSMGKLDASLEQFILAVKKDPNFIECFNYLGIVFRELKKYDKAYFYFKQALISDPKNNTYLSNLILNTKNLATNQKNDTL